MKEIIIICKGSFVRGKAVILTKNNTNNFLKYNLL